MAENYQPITGYAAADVGPREVLEDYSIVEDVVTAGGLYLKVGMICDGVGGVKSGERAAFMTANTTIEVMRNSYDTVVPRMMVEAVKEANRRVFHDSTSGKSTIAMYVIHLDGQTPYGRLYIASVGDSNVFLMRQGGLKRLNTDHNVANEMVLNGQATPEQAYALENAYHITRAIGVSEDVEVDIGFYYNAANREQARQRGKAGIAVEAGDSIFSCSDGLTDAGQDGLPYVREEEFLQHALDQDPQRAAKLFLSYALRRGTHDNVSVALMFVESPERSVSDEGGGRIVGIRTRYAVLGGILLLAISAAAIVAIVSVLGGRVNEQEREIEEVTRVAQATLAQNAANTLTATAYTPTPTNTPTPSPTLTPTPTPTSTPLPPLPPGAAGYLFTNPDEDGLVVQEGEEVTAGEDPLYIAIGNRVEGEHFGYVYFMANTIGQFLRVTDEEIDFFLHNNGDVFLQSKGFARGTEIEVESAPSARFYVYGSCMSIQQVELDILAACYDGTCNYTLSRGGAPQDLEPGQQIRLQLVDNELEVVEQTDIPVADARRYDGIIRRFNAPDAVSGRFSCAGAYVPTPVPTRRATSVPATSTNVPDFDGDGVPDNRDNCREAPGPAGNNGCPQNNPQPTNPPPPTSVPRPSNTPVPPPPPSNTPPPPPPPATNTPPPANTLPPPATNTPEPPPPQPTDTPGLGGGGGDDKGGEGGGGEQGGGEPGGEPGG